MPDLCHAGFVSLAAPGKVAPMKQLRFVAVLLALLVAPASIVSAQAQTTPRQNQDSGQKPSHIPTRQTPNSPFGTDWAKPPGTKGSYIYNDPRLPDPNSASPARRNQPCPAPLLSDPASGRCR